jgi:hypothetical protein
MYRQKNERDYIMNTVSKLPTSNVDGGTRRAAIKKYKSKTEVRTVQWFLDNHKFINANPINQRPDRADVMVGTNKNPSKAQKIIAKLVDGVTANLTMHKLDDYVITRYVWESIDGGHRKRAIIEFVYEGMPYYDREGNAVYFLGMPVEDREAFLDTEMTFTIYYELSPEDVAAIFQSLNNQTSVNHQEMLNSYGSIPIANVIREAVRYVSEVGNSVHELFESEQKDKSSKKIYKNIQFDNQGLKSEEMVARLAYWIWQESGSVPATDVCLEDMYSSDISEQQAKKLKKKLYKTLDFIQKMAAIRRNDQGGKKGKLPQREFSLFSRLYFYMQDTFGEYTIDDYGHFFEQVNIAYNPFRLKSVDDLGDKYAHLKEVSPFDSTKTVFKQFQDCLGEFDTSAHIRFPIDVLIKEGLDIESLIINIDDRTWSYEERLAKWIDQGKKCAVDGKPLAWEDAVAAHDIARAKGGASGWDNFTMVRRCYNIEQGTFNNEEAAAARASRVS